MEAEFRLEECRRASIPDLQQWLQLTYEIESKYIEERGNGVFKRLQEAKKMVGDWLIDCLIFLKY